MVRNETLAFCELPSRRNVWPIFRMSNNRTATLWFARQDRSNEEDLDKLVAKLNELKLLEDDWDGDGAVKPDNRLVDYVIREVRRHDFADIYGFPQRVFASVNGAVIMEFFSGQDVTSLEFENEEEPPQLYRY
jgi:hypothetical protein